MARIAPCLLCCLAATTAYAQWPANNIDLKAAYCFGRVRNLKPLDPDLFGTTGAPLVKTVNDRITSAQSRLRAYLMPRTKFVDISAISEAIKAGEADQAAYLPAISACWEAESAGGHAPAAIAQATKCTSQTTSDKLQECEQATFLPF